MRTGIIAIIILAMTALLLAGCSAPQCYPPNKIVGNKCCADDDANSVCDLDEPEQAAEEETPEAETQPAEETPAEEPQIQQVEKPKLEPVQIGITLGKQQMKPFEKRDYLEINDLYMYRSSTDKGVLNYMLFTVRNPSEVKLNPVVEVLFEKARLEEHQATVKKEYYLDPLEPGEKIVINQSMGIIFAKINETKEIHMRVWERYSAPLTELGTVEKSFTPVKEFPTMEIFIHGLPDE